MTIIHTSFGMIRYWSIHDADSLVKYANNRKIWINLRDGFPFPYTMEHAREFLAIVAQQNPVTFFRHCDPRRSYRRNRSHHKYRCPPIYCRTGLLAGRTLLGKRDHERICNQVC